MGAVEGQEDFSECVWTRHDAQKSDHLRPRQGASSLSLVSWVFSHDTDKANRAGRLEDSSLQLCLPWLTQLWRLTATQSACYMPRQWSQVNFTSILLTGAALNCLLYTSQGIFKLPNSSIVTDFLVKHTRTLNSCGFDYKPKNRNQWSFLKSYADRGLNTIS